MSVKSSVLGAVAITLFYFTTMVSSATDCSFLTFGQEMKLNDLPTCITLTVTKGEVYCCYSALRQPYCCDQGDHIVNLIIWLVAIVGVLCGIIIIIRRIWFYRRAGRFLM